MFIGSSINRFSRTAEYPDVLYPVYTNSTNHIAIAGNIQNIQEGDIVFAFITDDDSSCTVTSPGWTAVVVPTETNSIEHLIYYKVMGAVIDASLTLSANMDNIILFAFRGIDPSRIKLSSVVTAVGTTITPASITVEEDNSVVILFAAIDKDETYLASYDKNYLAVLKAAVSTHGSAAMLVRQHVPAGTETPGNLVWASDDNLLIYTMSIPPVITEVYNSGIWSLKDVYEDEI